MPLSVDFYELIVLEEEEVNNRKEGSGIEEELKIHCYLARIPQPVLAQLSY